MATKTEAGGQASAVRNAINHQLTIRLISILSIFLVWMGIASVFPNELMPFPIETVVICWDLIVSGTAAQNIIPTTIRSVLGFFASATLGTTIGIAMGLTLYFKGYFNPPIVFLLTLPGLLGAAITVLILGFNDLAVIVTVMFVAMPIQALIIWKAVESFDRDVLRMSRAFDVSNRRLFRDFLIPTMAPGMASAYRFGFAISWKIVVSAELFATQDGVGRLIVRSWGAFRYEETFAWVAFFAIIILALEYGFFAPLERRAFRYRQEHDFDVLR